MSAIRRGPRGAVLLAVCAPACAAAVVACAGPSYTYIQTTAPPELAPLVTVRDETFIVRLRNDMPLPVYLDWASARFVDVAGFERPLRLRSEHNVGTPDLPLDPGAAIAYQLEPAHYYAPPDRRWARRNSLRELVTYPDFYVGASSPCVLTDISGVLDEAETLSETQALRRERFDLSSGPSVAEPGKRLRVAQDTCPFRQRCVAQQGSGERGAQERDDAVG